MNDYTDINQEENSVRFTFPLTEIMSKCKELIAIIPATKIIYMRIEEPAINLFIQDFFCLYYSRETDMRLPGNFHLGCCLFIYFLVKMPKKELGWIDREILTCLKECYVATKK